jgi:hypothetical protein
MARRTTASPSRPPAIVDPDTVKRSQGRQVDWSLVTGRYRQGAVAVVVGAAGAALDATSVPVAALSGPIPSGTVLDFGGKKFARLTADALQGATALTVAALATALVSGDTSYTGGTGGKFIPALTVMVELASGKTVPRAIRPGAETAQFMIETDAAEDQISNALTGFGHIIGAHLFENLLPDASGDPAVLPGAYKTELRAFGGSWVFDQYADSRG